MGSGNSKVQKIEINSSSSQKQDFKKSSPTLENNNEISEKLDTEIALPVSATSKPDTETEEWTGPGMVIENEGKRNSEPDRSLERKGVSLITSEALIMGKKMLKSRPQHNNNCNTTLNSSKQA